MAQVVVLHQYPFFKYALNTLIIMKVSKIEENISLLGTLLLENPNLGSRRLTQWIRF
jgi:hypothetical protein